MCFCIYIFSTNKTDESAKGALIIKIIYFIKLLYNLEINIPYV